MSLKITFNKDAFTTAIETTEDKTEDLKKPEYKKYNMRFNNLDLAIIDAIAKRDGTSRSQILNNFITSTIQKTLSNRDNFNLVEAYFIVKYVDNLCKNRSKSDKNFTWLEWYANKSFGNHPISELEHHVYGDPMISERIKNDQYSDTLSMITKLLKKK